MRILRLILFFSVAIAAAIASEAAAAEDQEPAPPTTANASEFIRTSCETTQYPELCYHSLSGYANAVQQDPARLALVAIGVSLSRATGMSAYLANLTRGRNRNDFSDPRAAAALRDCSAVFGDAVSQMRGSINQMRRLSTFGEELRFQMSNVQTWMSAALTNEETCTDGFDGVMDDPIKIDVCDRTVSVKEVTSNALALVNSFAANC
ncbi:21 kDa protein-like [Andrographis paniculata]|uniref:21 kDa protein-like n=1 Tax=Andrographis paniculata TaxID=175694 RepID=UPI0021E89F69|nr:21 kDa protein-like [Andrographis paniculata]